MPDEVGSTACNAANGHTLLAIECPGCGAYSERLLDWLGGASAMNCDACDTAIDLTSGDNRALIDSLIHAGERLNAEFHGI